MKKLLLVSFSVLFLVNGFKTSAQELFTFGKNKATKEEFLKIHNKNTLNGKMVNDEQSLRESLNLYALFRMKVAEAHDLRLDTIEQVSNELQTYKNQLAKSYLSDRDVNRKLLDKAYQRLKEEVNASHILVAVSPQFDSVKAKNKIDSIYAKLKAGVKFETLAESHSDDKTTAKQGGNLGYFTALQVFYDFENVAYNTPKGQYSAPFRTQFGYHILKVNDKRKSTGKVQVQQILLNVPESRGEAGWKAAEEKVKTIQSEIKKGVAFEDLVAKYSDDKFSKPNKGLLEPFGIGSKSKEIENAAFGLKKVGDISEPVKSEYGYHIFKLIKKIPLQPLDSIKHQLTAEIEKDDRSQIAKKAYDDKVKQQYNFKENNDAFNKIVKEVTAKKELQEDFKPDNFSGFNSVLFSLAGKQYTQMDFIKYTNKLTRGRIHGNNPEATLNDIYKMYQQEALYNLQLDNLEKSNAEFRETLQEYNEGILLFALMERKVWTKASTDTAGIKAFFESRKEKYQWKPSFEGQVFQSGNKEDLERLKKLVDGGKHWQEAYDQLSDDKTNPTTISMQEGRFEMDKFRTEATSFKANKTTPIFLNDNIYTVVFTNKVIPNAAQKTIEEAKGYVVADYQAHLENEWNAALLKKYPLTINESVFKTLIKNKK